MTVFDAEIELYKWFSEHHSFEINRDFPKIVLVSDTPEDDRAAFLSALKDYESSSLVSVSVWDDKKYWILKRPFESIPQNVSVGSGVAMGMSNIINNFCEMTGDDADRCDPKDITEKDITNLLAICNLALSEHEKENKDFL